MRFIDSTYFDGDLTVVGVNTAPILAALDAAINEHEPICLDKVLGCGFAELFYTGLLDYSGGAFSNGFSTGFDIGHIPERWRWLRDGYVFNTSCKTIRWTGLMNADKRSLLANYVYFWYKRGHISQTNQSGTEELSKGENSTNAIIDQKSILAWNRMAEWVCLLHHILCYAVFEDGTRIYPEFKVYDTDCELFHSINMFGI